MVVLYLWSLFFILFPFYLFGSGLPQYADWVLAVAMIIILLSGHKIIDPRFRSIIGDLRYFVILVVIVNTIWAFFIDQSQEKRFPTYFHSLFYIYNFFVFGIAFHLYEDYGKKFITYTLYGVCFSVILQAAISHIGAFGARDELFFNNPNQLGYYALLSGSLVAYGNRYVRLNGIVLIAFFLAFFNVTVISASKAAVVGAVFLSALLLLDHGLLRFRQLSIILVFTVGLGYYFFTSNEYAKTTLEYTIARFETIGESKDDSYEGRGYDRIVNNPEYMVFGASEGGYYRFNTLLEAGEIHSTFGTVIFSYGILGFILFVRFLFKVTGTTILNILYLLPVLLYSITHHGLRSTFFWVFLALIYILGRPVIHKLSKQNGVSKNRAHGKPAYIPQGAAARPVKTS